MTLPKDTNQIELTVAAGIRKTLKDGSVTVDFGTPELARNFRFKVYDIVKVWKMRRGTLPVGLQGELEADFQNIMLSVEKGSSAVVWKDRRRLAGQAEMNALFAEELKELRMRQEKEGKAMEESGMRLLEELDRLPTNSQAGGGIVPTSPSPYPTRGS